MYTPSVDEIRNLRQRTAASIAHCKQALQEAKGDVKRALKILEQKGIARAANKAERGVEAGIIDAYIHHNKQLGVLLDLRCETDFVARNEEFAKLAHELCLQIAGANPLWISREDVPKEVLEEKTEFFKRELAQGKKSPEIEKKIVEGKLESFLQENCLLEQAYLKDAEKRVKSLIDLAIGKLGENIKVNAFYRLKL